MAAFLFVAFFVVLGLGTVLVAMSGGPRGARKALHTQSPGGRRFANIAIATIIVGFGVAVPAFALLDNHDDQSKEAAGGSKLNASQERGRGIFASKCATCHTLSDANAVGRVGPNLDQLQPTKALVLNAINLGRARGQGQMPAALLQGQDARDVANYVARVAGR